MDLARMVIGDPGHPKSVYGWGNHVFGGTRETPEFQSIVYDFDEFTLTCDNACATNYMIKTPNDIRQDNTRFPDWRNNATRTEIYGTEGVDVSGASWGGGWQVLGPGNEIVAQDGGVMPDDEHQVDFIRSLRTRKTPNGEVEECHRSATLVHLGNIAFRTGNRQLLFDSATEQITNNEQANKLVRGSYRSGYVIPEKV